MEYDTFQKIVKYFENKDTYQSKVFKLLKDCQWHCRKCEGKSIGSGQYAGGGGIQGLERGTKSRWGLVIEENTIFCKTCEEKTKQDRLTGEIKPSNAASGIPNKLIKRVLEIYDYTDVMEERKRPKHELVVDHRVPMERWESAEGKNDSNMSTDNIRKKFQLLKKDEGGNHNLLKSRSCEKCIKTGLRGYPFGIKYWYKGTEKWPKDISKKDERGCIGCGWYDLIEWRNSLNSFMTDK